MGKINYIMGDATDPIGRDNVIIAHICNDVGLWGNGFVLAIEQKWPHVKECYLKWSKSDNRIVLGNVQFVGADRKIVVANMICQRDVQWQGDMPPIRYQDLNVALHKVAKRAQDTNASVHMPRIGTGLAGGDWSIIEDIIYITLVRKELDVYVYDLPERNNSIGRVSPIT